MKALSELIARMVIEFSISLGCVAVAWNLLLPKLFTFVPVLGVKELCLLTIAIDLILTPATMGGAVTRGKILRILRGEEE